MPPKATAPSFQPSSLPQGFGYDPDLAPYPFDPDRTRHLLRQAGYANGLPVILLATKDLEVQATVVSKMLEHAGFQVELRLLTPAAYNRQTLLSHLEQSPEQQAWDIALTAHLDLTNSPVFMTYHWFALDGPYDWVNEQPELRQLYTQVKDTVDRDHQQEVIRQMERHAHDQAYFLFLYNPITLYAVNKAVEFVPYVNTVLTLAETGVTSEHWSMRKQKAAVHE